MANSQANAARGRQGAANIPVNVVVSESDERRILNEERAWSGPKLVVVLLVTLALAIAALWFMSGVSCGAS